MLVSSNRWNTFCQLLNIIDLLAILPFMLEISLWLAGIKTEQLRDLKVPCTLLKFQKFLGCFTSGSNFTSFAGCTSA